MFLSLSEASGQQGPVPRSRGFPALLPFEGLCWELGASPLLALSFPGDGWEQVDNRAGCSGSLLAGRPRFVDSSEEQVLCACNAGAGGRGRARAASRN